MTLGWSIFEFVTVWQWLVVVRWLCLPLSSRLFSLQPLFGEQHSRGRPRAIPDLLMHNTSPGCLADRLRSISSFLSRPLVSTLFAFHPNDLAQSLFRPPPEWQEWWDWPGHLCDNHQPEGPEQQDPWLILLRYYESCLSGHKPSDRASLIPPNLRSLISDASQLALPRDVGQLYPNHRSTDKPPHYPRESETKHLPGMSPKKAHEVAHLVAHLATLMSPGSPLCDIHHVVDIGAGQVRRFFLRDSQCQNSRQTLISASTGIFVQGITRSIAPAYPCPRLERCADSRGRAEGRI